MAEELRPSQAEEDQHKAQFTAENPKLSPSPQEVFLDGTVIGDIRNIQGKIIGGFKRILIPQLAIKLGASLPIPVLAAKGRVVAAANPGRQDAFHEETSVYNALASQSNINILTNRVGRPSAILQDMRTTNDYFSTESAVGSISLQQILDALTSLHAHMIDPEIGMNADNFRIFKEAILFKFLAGAFSALEELHATCNTSTNDPQEITVYTHGDFNWHAGNAVLNIVPGRGTFGNAVLLDLARVKETTIWKKTYANIADVYASNPGSDIDRDHRDLERTVKALLTGWQHPNLFPQEINPNQMWTGPLFDEVYLKKMGELRTKLGRQHQDFDTKFEPDIQDSFFTGYIGTLLDNKANTSIVTLDYTIEHAKKFAEAIKRDILGGMETQHNLPIVRRNQ